MKPIEQEFRERSIVRGGGLMLRADDAIALVRECRKRNIKVLGIDGFHLTATTTQPDLVESEDFSTEILEARG